MLPSKVAHSHLDNPVRLPKALPSPCHALGTAKQIDNNEGQHIVNQDHLGKDAGLQRQHGHMAASWESSFEAPYGVSGGNYPSGGTYPCSSTDHSHVSPNRDHFYDDRIEKAIRAFLVKSGRERAPNSTFSRKQSRYHKFLLTRQAAARTRDTGAASIKPDTQISYATVCKP
jgi:hypothetical protein